MIIKKIAKVFVYLKKQKNYKTTKTIAMMITEDEITKIFCMADDFSKIYDKFIKANGLGPKRDRRKREYHRAPRLSDSEVITIMILFHFSGYRCLKHFYVGHVCPHMLHLFPRPVSYNRFTELEKKVAVPLILFLKKCLMRRCTGISFVDSTALRVCRNQRIHLHRVFRGLAQRGQCSMGWFYGFKLHLICNEKGELLSFMLTPGNIDDRDPLKNSAFLENISGKLVGDKGYISKGLFEKLFVDGIQLLTKVRSNMKGALMTVADKILLRKRAIIECVNDELKNMAQIEHSRHRSVANFAVNLVAALSAYCFFPKKPMIDLCRSYPLALYNQLSLF